MEIPVNMILMKQCLRLPFCVLSILSDSAGLAQTPGQLYGTTSDGTPVYVYTLSNTKGMQAQVISYGGIVTSLTAPDRSGKYADVVLGFDDFASYQRERGYYGAIIGRYGNRIGGAQFTLENKTYRLPKNNAGNALHGGLQGFDKRVWDALVDIPFAVRALDRVLAGLPEGATVAELLIGHPDRRAIVERVQGLQGHPCGEVRGNVVAADFQPCHIIRFALSLLGVEKFEPVSSKWVRGTFLQGAPLAADVAAGVEGDWL